MERTFWPDNTPGRFAVDTECILCSLCSDIAPAHFRMSDEETHDICYRQPETPEEVADCQEALLNCPTESIVDQHEAT
ncbi:MAG: ferredoxin [Myxococcota bacterium]|jgi:ferredoxin